MNRKSSLSSENNPTNSRTSSAPTSTTNLPYQHTCFESQPKVNSDPNDTDNIPPRRESLHKPTWQNIIPGQPVTKLNATTTSSKSKTKSICLTSDSDDDEYLRRPSVVVHHHYYQDKEVQQQLQLPSKPMPQLRRASLYSGVCFKSPSRDVGNAKITRHHTIASADLKITSDNNLKNCQRKSSLIQSSRSFGLVTQSGTQHVDDMTTISADSSSTNNGGHTSYGSTSGGTFCKNAGRTLMRMLSGSSRSSVTETYEHKENIQNDGGEEYDIMGKNKVVVVDGTRVKLQIWDTAGQERFRSVTHAYYRDAHALLLLYDVTNKTTYDNIRAWLGEIREYAQDDVVIVLIGNKADSSNSERQVKREDGERLAREHNVPFMETSAKTGLNVELAFSAVARQLKFRGTVNGDDGKFNVHDFVRDNTRARTMCAQCKSM